ncbi:uncharacterized protein PHACADRAFT_212748 [Phanerochaete carnosa HHB-10118-sp]|uniref:Protein-S-isoprenylcysteine O-methyltransferase n=1 Tax=Phanerochaete carnosa (strain HHB-10118-sp) TaxID=650164 RepID=K5VL79_PHACS|nr:uncharacterized protein PHACADRAFT_212748 [Phanerochaete carnosa HHB-10118-sp]EKM52178.1 hypothetical protein PHACADRAFT_212748 [Phanerochaete carnosa HHB-10118-sp]
MDTVLCLRIALLVAGFVSSHISSTPPNAAPHAEERARYEEKQALGYGEKGFTSSHAGILLKYTIYMVNFIDLLVILSAERVLIADELRAWLPITTVGRLSMPPAFAIGTLFMVVGTLIRVASYRQLGRHFTFELAIRKDHKLVTSGPYSVVRHPSYTGYWVYITGIAVSQLGPGSLYAELGLWRNPLGFLAGEDSALLQEFGDEWLVWAKRTPYRLVPGIY